MDFWQDSVQGCGIDIAHKLAQYGLGDTLLHAANTLPLLESVSTFLVNWRTELCRVLTSDPLGILQCKYCDLAHDIWGMTDFPDPAVIAGYLSPLTSWSKDKPDFSNLVTSCQPDLTAISRFCVQCFSWSAEVILKWLGGVWTAVVVQALCRVSYWCCYKKVCWHTHQAPSTMQHNSDLYVLACQSSHCNHPSEVNTCSAACFIHCLHSECITSSSNYVWHFRTCWHGSKASNCSLAYSCYGNTSLCCGLLHTSAKPGVAVQYWPVLDSVIVFIVRVHLWSAFIELSQCP